MYINFFFVILKIMFITDKGKMISIISFKIARITFSSFSRFFFVGIRGAFLARKLNGNGRVQRDFTPVGNTMKRQQCKWSVFLGRSLWFFPPPFRFSSVFQVLTIPFLDLIGFFFFFIGARSKGEARLNIFCRENDSRQ